MKKRLIIKEAQAKEYMTDTEKALKKRLIALLKNDGRGHRHAKFAARLADFDVKIVPLGKQPETAAISFDEGVIYINQGFLLNKDTFFQLNVLMRHELAHYLMQHQIRMIAKLNKKYGKEATDHIMTSYSLHDLINGIMDFEISNERYTEEDKAVVRNMMLNGRIIGGLVTEDHEPTWQDLPLGEMYERLLESIDRIHAAILAVWEAKEKGTNPPNSLNQIQNNYTNNGILSLYFYAQAEGPSNILGSAEDFINNKALYHYFIFDERDANGNVRRPCMAKFSSFSKTDQELFTKLYNGFLLDDKVEHTKQQVRDIIKTIAKSKPTDFVDVESPITGQVFAILYTPEEKLMAVDLLKVIIPELEPYNTWFAKVKRVFSDPKYSDDDIIAVTKALND